MKQSNLDLLQKSIADTAAIVRTQLDTLPDQSTPLRQRLTRLLNDLNTYLQSDQNPPDHLRPESEAQYRLLFEAIDEGVCIIQVIFDEQNKPFDYKFVEVNPAFERQTGIKNAVGRRMREIAPAHENHWFEIYGKVALTGESIRFENVAEQLNRYYDVFAFRVGEPALRTVAVVFNDITDRKRREQNTSFLSEMTEQLISRSNAEEIMQVFGEQVHQFFGSSVASFFQISETQDQAVINNDWHYEGGHSLVGQYDLTQYVTDEFRSSMAAGRIAVIRDVSHDPRIKNPESFSDLKIGSFLNIPLIRGGYWKFTLGVFHERPYHWRDDQIELLVEIAGRIWNKLERLRAEEALIESEIKYRTLFESMDEGYVLAEVQFDETDSPVDIRYLDANPAAVKMTGTELVGKTSQQLDLNYERHWYDIFGRVAKTGIGERHELSVGSSEVWYNFYVFKVGSPDSRLVAAIYQDITERKRSEFAKQRAAAHDAFRVELMDALQPLTDVSEIRLMATRILGQHLNTNRVHYAEISDDDTEIIIDQGYTNGVPSLAGRYVMDDLEPEFAAMLRTGHLIVMSDIQQAAELTEASRRAYANIQVRSHVAVPLIKGGRLAAGLSIHQSVPRIWTSDEVKLIEETADRIWSAVTYAHNAQHAQERAVFENRQQLARDLHDSVTQTLFAASILTQASLRQFNRDPEKVAQRLKEIDKQVRGAMGEMRALLLELRPDNVQNTMFAQLLKNLIDGVQSRRRIEINLSFDDEPTLPPEVRLGIYRIAQEIINNITKHSNASQAWITGHGGTGFIELNFRDNGVGFSADTPIKGMGLQIMRERAQEIGAHLVINSVPQQGTEVQISWPQSE